MKILTQVNFLKNKNLLKVVKNLSFHCAKLYNVGLYSVKEYYKLNNEYLCYAKNYHECKTNENYKYLLTDIGQQVLRMVERDMKSYFSLLKIKQKGKYSEKVRLPNFKSNNMVVSIPGRSCRIKGKKIYIGLTKTFKDKYKIKYNNLIFDLPKNVTGKLREVRFVPSPSGKYFEINYVYEQIESPKVSGNNSLGIDFGVNNFAACFNSNGHNFLLDGRRIKSINQLYNKIISKTLPKSRKRERQSLKRKYQIGDIFNKYVNLLVNYCNQHGITTIVCGELKKQNLNIGKINNQNFCYIPYGIFVRKLKSKCAQYGIEIHLQDESYTSKCSFLDNEEVCKHDSYMGKRICRGLFRTSSEKLINSDCNGAANILVKFYQSKHRAFSRVSSGFVTNPILVRV